MIKYVTLVINIIEMKSIFQAKIMMKYVDLHLIYRINWVRKMMRSTIFLLNRSHSLQRIRKF